MKVSLDNEARQIATGGTTLKKASVTSHIPGCKCSYCEVEANI